MTTATANIYDPPVDPSPNVRAVLSYIAALNNKDVNRETLEHIQSHFHPRLEHHILPRSLGRPVLTKNQYGDYYVAVRKMYADFEVTLHELIESAKGDCVVVHATGHCVSKTGARYINEYTTFFYMAPSPAYDPEGLPKFILIKEFVDSHSSLEFFKAERARVAARK
ncbi:hypothetical protein PLICRDRAFT_96072 [Plicaturopsis crispa FD-325 SS-3]|nr:hypothetical protein PLICRDRAFT_96072 [Plicaturopsis crispa FD-325 SS-3]